jgi:predicted Zn-dependent protease with MMP-like domain
MLYSTPPTLEDLETLAAGAFKKIPAPLRQHVDGVAIRVVDFPDEATCNELALESQFDLLGLYHGLPLDEKSVADQPLDVDIIFLYRRPLLDHWVESGEALDHLVRHVLIHEIGHHFGFSDAEMEALEAETGG